MKCPQCGFTDDSEYKPIPYPKWVDGRVVKNHIEHSKLVGYEVDHTGEPVQNPPDEFPEETAETSEPEPQEITAPAVIQ